MVAIGSLAMWNPGRGPVTAWTASAASREIMAGAARDPLPPSFQQASHLRTAYFAREVSREVPRLIIAAWDVDGICDIAAMTEAINTHLRRHDTYHSAFEVSGPDAETITRRTVEDPELIEFVPSALGMMEESEIRAHVLGSTPGTLEWDCFVFGVVQKADHFSVYASIDHLHTDGMSAAVIYRDIHWTYQALLHDVPNPLPRPGGYRDFTARQNLQVAATTMESTPVKDWVEFARDAEGAWPTFPLEMGESTGTAGAAVTVELLDAAQTAAFDTACRAVGARFSGGVMACAALADHRLTGEETFRALTPSDTRSGEEQALSAGWYASLFPVVVPVDARDFGRTARAAQRSFDANKHLAGVPFQRVLDLAEAGNLGITPAGGPSMMVSLFDFRGMADADADRLGLYIDDLSHGDVNMWLTRHADKTTATVSFPATMTTRHSVHHYLGVLRSVFLEIADGAFAHSAQLAG